MFCVCLVSYERETDETTILYRLKENGVWDYSSDRIKKVPGNQIAKYPIGTVLTHTV